MNAHRFQKVFTRVKSTYKAWQAQTTQNVSDRQAAVGVYRSASDFAEHESSMHVSARYIILPVGSYTAILLLVSVS